MTFDQDVIDKLSKAIENNGTFVLWGSRLYGSQRSESDHDFQLIVKDSLVEDVRILLSRNWNARNGDVHLHSNKEYTLALENHKPWAIEIALAPDSFYTTGKTEFSRSFKLDKVSLRNEFARTASNSYVKTKKKLLVNDYNPIIAKKSMFHSLRLLDYAKQIAENGKIVDWSSSNMHLSNLLALPNDWKTIEAEYKPVYNQLASALRAACPRY